MDEGHPPVGHHNSPIILCLVQGVVPRGLIVVIPDPQNGKLLLNVPLERQQDGDGRHENIADKGLDQVRENGGQAVPLVFSLAMYSINVQVK